MTIGTEEGKGNALITETNDLLRRVGDLINYAGPIEGFHVFAEHVDVVVCDGFVGNIMLKSWESLVKFFLEHAEGRAAGKSDAGDGRTAVERRVQRAQGTHQSRALRRCAAARTERQHPQGPRFVESPRHQERDSTPPTRWSRPT